MTTDLLAIAAMLARLTAQSLTAIGGVYPYTWSITAGSLPSGLNLNGSTGAITGTPPQVGTLNFTVQVADSETPPVRATAQLSITINARISIAINSVLGPLFSPCGPDIQGIVFYIHGGPFIAGDVVSNAIFGPLTYEGSDPNNIWYQIVLQEGCVLAWQDFQVTTSDGQQTSNIVGAGIVGNQNTAALDPAGDHFELRTDLGSNNVQIYHGNNPGDLFSAPAFAVDYDNGTNSLMFVSAGTAGSICGGACVLMLYGTDGGFKKALNVTGLRGEGFDGAALNGFGGVDNTWATPLFFKSFAHGADVSIQAATKYIVGHADAMLGTITASKAVWPAIARTHEELGLCVGPEDAYLGLRGLRSLGVRLARHQASALALAEWLKSRPEVARVIHPALPSDPGHAIWKRDFTGASGLFAIVLKPVPKKAVAAMLDGLDLFGMGYSWGGFESLMIPFDPSTYRTATEWQAEGPALRLHVGLEDLDDLKADLEAGFARLTTNS